MLTFVDRDRGFQVPPLDIDDKLSNMRESKSESESERDEKSRVYYLIPFVEKLSFAFCDNLAEAFRET